MYNIGFGKFLYNQENVGILNDYTPVSVPFANYAVQTQAEVLYTAQGEVPEGEYTVPIGKADLYGQCMEIDIKYCGGQSSGNCWCDDLCTQYGDCCADYAPVCGG